MQPRTQIAPRRFSPVGFQELSFLKLLREMVMGRGAWPAMAAVLLATAATGLAQQTITVTPQSLTFADVEAGTLSDPQMVSVMASTPTTVTVNTAGSPQWLSVLPNGPVNVNDITNTQLSVRVNAQALPEGTHQGSFIISVNQQQTPPVTVTVTAVVTGDSLLSANPSQLNFTTVEHSNSGTPAATTVQVGSSGADLNYNIQANVAQGNWLLLSTTTGNTGGPGFTVSVNPGDLAPGTYQGTILVTSQTSSDSVQISVTMTVNANASLTVTPGDLPPFLHQIGQIAPAPKVLQVSSSGGSVAFTVSIDADSPSAWLVVNPLSGSAGAQPANVTVSVNPAGLSPGTYTADIIIDPANGPPLPPVPVTLVVSVNPLLTLSETELSFFAPFGGDPPAEQTVNVNAIGVGSPVGFSFTVNQSWVTVVSSANQTPATLAVEVDPSGLSIGTHEAKLVATPLNGDDYTREVAITLEIADTAELTAGPGALLFSFRTAGTTPQPQTVSLRSIGQTTEFQLSTDTDNCNDTWLSAIGSATMTPSLLTVSVNVAGLAPGTCTGTVTVDYLSAGQPESLTVPVKLEVSNNAVLEVSLPQDFGVLTVQQGQTPPTQIITLTSSNPLEVLPFNITTSSTGGAWLQSSGSGTTPANGEISFFTSTLPPGMYTGEVLISSANLPSSSFSVPVSLRVLPNINVTVTPQSLSFLQSQGGTPPEAKNIVLTSSAPGATFTSSINYLSGADWLELDRTSGSATGAIGIRIKQNSLPQNTYTARVNLSFQNAATAPVMVTVVLNVSAPRSISTTTTELSFTHQLGSAPPNSKILQLTSSPGGLAFTLGTTSSGWLSAVPSSGNAPTAIEVAVDVEDLAAGTYSGSVSITSPGASGSPLTIPVTLTIQGPPAPQPITITNSASGAPGAIAPGEIVTIKGTSLGPASPEEGISFSVGPGNTVASQLAGVRVLFDNIPGTVLYVSDTQINVTVPYEIAGRVNVAIRVEYLGQSSSPITVLLATAAPGIYTLDATGSGQAAALNGSGGFNGPGGNTSPAAVGESIVVYLTGGGQTNPASQTGSITPAALPYRLIPGTISATIGGLPATIEFLGGAPGLVTGAVQGNLKPHPDAHGLALPVVITINGISTPLGATVAIQ